MNDTTRTTRRGRAGFVNPELRIVLALLAIALAAVIIFLSRGGGGSASPPPPTQEEIDQRLGALQQDYQTARQEKQDIARIAARVRVFTEDHPGEQGGFVLLAQTLMETRQWEQAYTALKQALSIEASTYELDKLTGFCAAKLGRNDEALGHYQRAAEDPGADYKVFTALGLLYLSRDEPGKAEQAYDRAVDARGPGKQSNYRHEAFAGLADVAAVREDFDQALTLVDRAIKMAGLDSQSDNAGYHIQKARIYMEAGRDEDAVTMLGYTWSQFGDAVLRIESARLRARLYERADELGKAVDYLQSITELHRVAEDRRPETLADFTALLADWQIKAQRLEDAKVSLHNLQTLMPTHPAVDGLKAKLR